MKIVRLVFNTFLNIVVFEFTSTTKLIDYNLRGNHRSKLAILLDYGEDVHDNGFQLETNL